MARWGCSDNKMSMTARMGFMDLKSKWALNNIRTVHMARSTQRKGRKPSLKWSEKTFQRK